MNIKLYNISKDTKSLKLPTNLVHETNECYYKERVSIDSPVIVLTGEVNTYTFNYAMLEGKYYFVNDKVHVNNNHCEYSLEIDLLATYRNDILNSRQYVTRASYIGEDHQNIHNVKITDTFYPVSGNTDVSYLEGVNNGFTSNFDFYVLGVIGNGEDINGKEHSIGSVTYYLLTPLALKAFIAWAFEDTTWEDISGFTSQLAKALYKPMDYIISCKGYCVEWPTNFSELNGFYACNQIKLAYFKLQLEGLGGEVYIIDDKASLTNSKFFDFNHHSSWNERLYYYDYRPYTSVSLEFPTVCTIDVDMTKLYENIENNKFELTVDFVTSLIDGNTLVKFRKGTSIIPFHIETCNIGVNIPLAKTTVNVLGTVLGATTTAVGTVGNIAVENYGGAVGSLSNGIGNTLQNSIPQSGIATNGTPSTIYYKQGFPKLKIERRYTTPHDVDHFGDPVCAPMLLGELHGYVECKDSEISIPGAFKPHIDNIKNLLNGGVYIE